MDYNTENTIIEIVKKRPIGRPKIFTAEEQKEKTKIISQRYYQNNCEQKKEYVNRIISKTEMLCVSEKDYII